MTSPSGTKTVRGDVRTSPFFGKGPPLKPAGSSTRSTGSVRPRLAAPASAGERTGGKTSKRESVPVPSTRLSSKKTLNVTRSADEDQVPSDKVMV